MLSIKLPHAVQIQPDVKKDVIVMGLKQAFTMGWSSKFY